MSSTSKWIDEHKDDGKIYFPQIKFGPDLTTKLTLWEFVGIKRFLPKKFIAEGETGKGQMLDLSDLFNGPASGVIKTMIKFDITADVTTFNKELEYSLHIKIQGSENSLRTRDFKRILSELGL